jgi:hypothetical protein
VQVDGALVGRQHVAARFPRDRHTGTGFQPASQPGKVARQRIAGPVRGLVGPYPIDQPIHRDRTVDVDQKGNQDATLAGMTDLETLPVETSLDIAEQPEFHRHLSQPSPGRWDVSDNSRRQPWRAPIQCSRS